MFSIYGVTGRTFRGTLENLGPVAGLTAVRHGRGIAREGEELGPEMRGPEMRGPDHARDEAEAAARYEEATQAYRRMLRAESDRGQIRHAYQIMSRNVASLGPETGVDEAWRFLAARGFGQAPVLDAGRRLLGMVFLNDLLAVLNVDEYGLRDIQARAVGDVMTTPVITADPVSDVRRVARVLLDYDLAGISVVGESDELVGIITRGDILRAVIHDPPLSLWA